MIRIKQGLDLPISGAPDQTVRATHDARRVAVLGSDFVGMKPALEVAVGDTVSCGGRLLTDRKNSGVLFTAPAAGTVVEINRGARRVFESLVIERTDSGGRKQMLKHEFVPFKPSAYKDPLLDRGCSTARSSCKIRFSRSLGLGPTA